MPSGRAWTIDLFLAKTNRAGECIEWTGYRDANGYGGTRYRGAPERAHRLSWILHFGPIPEGRDICHRCDNPPCVNPAHLFVGTARDNIIDMRTKGRHGTAKLTVQQADEIRGLAAKGLMTQTAIAAMFGVTQTQISDIVRGRCWGTTPRALMKRKSWLKPDQVSALRADAAAGMRQVDIADKYGLTQSGVSRIVLRKVWKHI